MKITIQNFKSFGVDPQTLELAPLTFMLGANSTGKSSMFQILLALRQSIEAGRWLELLPTGRRIDLGSFRNFVHLHDLGRQITLVIEHEPLGRIEFVWNPDDDGNRGVLERIVLSYAGCTLDLLVSTSVSESRDVLRDLEFTVRSITFFDIAQWCSRVRPASNTTAAGSPSALAEFVTAWRGSLEGVGLDDEDEDDDDETGKDSATDRQAGSGVQPSESSGEEAEPGLAAAGLHREGLGGLLFLTVKPHPLRLLPMFDIRWPGEVDAVHERHREVARLQQTIDETHDALQLAKLVRERDELATQLDQLTEQTRTRADAQLKAAQPELEVLVEALGRWLATLMRVRYVGPLRHPGKRVTTVDNDLDDDVGSAGERLFDVLIAHNQLRNEVNAMLERMKIDHRVEVNVALEAKTTNLGEIVLSPRRQRRDGEVAVGLPDVGMGVRQVLPVLASVASTMMRADRVEDDVSDLPEILLVEQPELHLHPRLQMTLSTAVVERIQQTSDRRRPIFIVFETHGEHMVIRTQSLVRKGKVKPEDISLLAIEPHAETSVATVKRMRLTSAGAFRGMWPRGFFNERAREMSGADDD